MGTFSTSSMPLHLLCYSHYYNRPNTVTNLFIPLAGSFIRTEVLRCCLRLISVAILLIT